MVHASYQSSVILPDLCDPWSPSPQGSPAPLHPAWLSASPIVQNVRSVDSHLFAQICWQIRTRSPPIRLQHKMFQSPLKRPESIPVMRPYLKCFKSYCFNSSLSVTLSIQEAVLMRTPLCRHPLLEISTDPLPIDQPCSQQHQT